MTKYQDGQYIYGYDGAKLFDFLRKNNYEAMPDKAALSTFIVWDLIDSDNLVIAQLQDKPDEFWEQLAEETLKEERNE